MSEASAIQIDLSAALGDHAQMDSLEWRLDHIYWIVNKEAKSVPFEMNDQQRDFIQNIWYRNLILKARQLGFSTLLQVLELDQAMMNGDFNCVVIADTLPNAGKLFKKVEFAYDHLPDLIKQMFPVLRKNQGSEIVFGHMDADGKLHPSTISVSVSARGGTVQLLHVSELGKIGLKFPQRAEEIKTGAFEAVPQDGCIVVESTAEGAFGLFYELCEPAMKRRESGAPETVLDWRLHFYPWFDCKDYRLSDEDTEIVEIPSAMTAYFRKLEAELKITIDRNQRAWYAKKAETQGKKMKQEYPACIAGFEPTFSPAGITRMDQVPVDGAVVSRFVPMGEKDVFRLTTDLGYEVTCTADHPIKTPSGFVELKDLAAGEMVMIGAAVHAVGTPQAHRYQPLPLVKATVYVTEDLGEFLGFFMGDGSFHDGTLSIVCDRGDLDVIERVEQLIDMHVSKPITRIVGSKGGGAEVRAHCIELGKVLDSMGLLRRNAAGGLMRLVHVPAMVNQSPLPVARAFLRGLFEADGFAARNGTGVKFFTKYAAFARDVQLLLLRFGITCRRTASNKTAGNGAVYEGWELSLRTAEAIKFAADVGFVSTRKQGRATALKPKTTAHQRLPIATAARITSITPAGRAQVFDITTATHEFSAGGIVVHNCPKEAFEQAIEGAVYGDQMTWLREHGRIGRVPLDPTYPVDTFWDFGVNDANTIWFHQQIGLQHRWFYYIEGNGKGLKYWWLDVCEKHRLRHGYSWGKHYLPHDADAEILGEVVTTKHRILEKLGMRNIVVVPRIATIGQGIEITRTALVGNHWFDDHKPDEKLGEDMGAGHGIRCLDGYQFTWNDKTGVWSAEPLHNWASHGADGWRQFAQGYQGSGAANSESLAKFKNRERRWR